MTLDAAAGREVCSRCRSHPAAPGRKRCVYCQKKTTKRYYDSKEERGLDWAKRVIYASRVRAKNRGHLPILDPPEEVLSRFIAAGGCCEICGFETESLHCDHDHTTGRVRGFLCSNCNVAVGLAGDDADRLIKMATYLQNHEHFQRALGPATKN